MVPASPSPLIAAAAFSALAAIAHIGVVVVGPAWYRLFGAGEEMARLAERGSWYPAIVTLTIAAVLALWSAYALSGAGLLPRLPLLTVALITITSVYLVRGVAGFFLGSFAPGGNSPAFWFWSSAICLLIGIVHAVGAWKNWSFLTGGHT